MHPVYILLTMRTDFLGECTLFTGLPDVLNESLYLCPRLTRDQLTQAIVNPAAMFEGSVAPELVRQIIREASTNPDQLPLVQHALARLWRLNGRNPEQTPSQNQVLELPDYLNLGGMFGETPTNRSRLTPNATTPAPALPQAATSDESNNPVHRTLQTATSNALSRHCDIAYLELHDETPASQTLSGNHIPSRRQQICRSLFCSLAEHGLSGKFVRHPRTVGEVAAIAGCSTDEICSIAEVFRREGRNFLVHSADVELVTETVLDISHEALIRQWTRLGADDSNADDGEKTASWLSIEQTTRRNYRRIFDAACNECKTGLLQSPELEYLNNWWNELGPTTAWANGFIPDSFAKTDSSTVLPPEASARSKSWIKSRSKPTHPSYTR